MSRVSSLLAEVIPSNINPLRAQAWRRMFLERTCPPIGLLKTNDERIKYHLKSCNVCRDSLASIHEFEKAGEMLSHIEVHIPNDSIPTIGEIRKVRPNGQPINWFDHEWRYHNPPHILVLSDPDKDGRVQVAQLFDEKELCDFGDIPINNGMFAEGWNVYFLPIKNLDKKVFYPKVSSEIIERVGNMSKTNMPYLEINTALCQFRILELAVGSFFSIPINFA